MSEPRAADHSEVSQTGAALRRTPLYALHKELGAKLVPFAGYEMPVSYGTGIVKEHNHVRATAGLFDVSHMGQARLDGPTFEEAARALEALVPADVLSLQPGQLRYTQLTSEAGGIIDDLMVAGSTDGRFLSIVANASRKGGDFEHIAANLPRDVKLTPEPDLALLALQGPEAAQVLDGVFPGVSRLSFLGSADAEFAGVKAVVARSGYTGEDGFEISIEARHAESLARAVLANARVLPAGLGARDTLRLEAGLCLYGQDIGEQISPVEAGLSFSIGKRRRIEGGFPGAARILRELAEGPSRIRIGLKLEGRAAARPGTPLEDGSGNRIGVVTSGAYTPTAAASVAMAYVPTKFSAIGTQLFVEIRGARVPTTVVKLPFVPHRYVRPSNLRVPE